MRIRARHIKMNTVVELQYPSIKDAKKRNPFLVDFEVIGNE